MKKILVCLAVSACWVFQFGLADEGRVPSGSVELKKGPVRVFLLIGQSNMNGRGTVDVLRDKLIKDHPGKYPASLMEIRDDVWITGANGNGISHQMNNVRLEPGFGQFKYYGPELGFGHVMGDHYDEPVMLIKNIAGGTPLATVWTSPSAAKRTGRQGPLQGRRAAFQSTFYKVKKTLENLPTLIEGYNPGQGYQIMGIVWVHGNADGGNFSEEYEDNLVDFITDLRALFGIPELPFIAVESLSSRAPGSAFQNAVDRVNKRDGNSHAAAILTKSKIDLKEDPNYSAYNASGDGTHWRHNARAFLDVGYWAAEMMKPLLAATANHAADGRVQQALDEYARLFEEGNANHVDPIYEEEQRRNAGRPPMKQAGGNNYN